MSKHPVSMNAYSIEYETIERSNIEYSTILFPVLHVEIMKDEWSVRVPIYINGQEKKNREKQWVW